MDRGTEDVFHGFVCRFSEGRMRMDRVDYILNRSFKGDCRNRFRNHESSDNTALFPLQVPAIPCRRMGCRRLPRLCWSRPRRRAAIS